MILTGLLARPEQEGMMNAQRMMWTAAVAGLLVSGCSTKPRNFAASVSTPISDAASFEKDYRACDNLVRSGRKSGFRDAAATGLATGAATVGTGALAVATGTGGVNIATGAMSAGFAAMPFIGVLAGFGVSRAIRGGKERKLKRSMTDCLGEYGYTVADWQKLPKKADAARYSVDHAAVAKSTPTAAEPSQQADAQLIAASVAP